LNSVEGPLHRTKPEVRNEAVHDSSLNDSGQQWIAGLYFSSVEILKAPDLQPGWAQTLNVHEGLLYESIGLVRVAVVRGVIRGTQSELPLGSRHDSVIRQSENGRLLAFDEPVEPFTRLTDADAQQRIPEAVVAVSSIALKPVPAFGTCPPVDRDLERSNLVLCRSTIRGTE